LKTYLLDANVLIALAWPQHVHHATAHKWFAKEGKRAWASCAITQLAFVRISSNPGIISSAVSPREACGVLEKITKLRGHRFWNETAEVCSLDELKNIAVVGYRQVTDAYLIGLARLHQGHVATLDRGMQTLAPVRPGESSIVELIE
jgi:uncharacterized protein